MTSGSWWLDPRLADLVGSPDPAARQAIERVIDEVALLVLGSETGPLGVPYLDLHAPWARDLARGLHWLALGHSPEPPTPELVEILTDRPLVDEQRKQFAADIDLAFALTYHRHVDTIAGYGASASIAVSRRRADRPWLETTLLGWRLHLTVELLRLTHSDSLLD